MFCSRTAVHPAGEESSSSEDLPVSLSRQISNVSSGQDTSPLRRHLQRGTFTTSLPAGVDLPAVACLMVWRPLMSVAELMRVADGQLPRQDASPFGLHAMRLAVQLMLVYEHVLTAQLHAQSTLGYSMDATGWTSLRQCAARLEALGNRPPRTVAPEDTPSTSRAPMHHLANKIFGDNYVGHLLPKLTADCKHLLPADFISQQDGTPAHMACVTQNWLQAKCPGFIK